MEQTLSKTSVKTRVQHIEAAIDDMVAKFLYYDRKEDDDLPVGAIEDALIADEIRTRSITARIFNAIVASTKAREKEKSNG